MAAHWKTGPRLTLEVTDAVAEVMGADRVGVRLSPDFTFNDIEDTGMAEMALYLGRELSARQIAYLHIAEAGWVGGKPASPVFRQQLREAFSGALILCGEQTAQSGEQLLSDGLADAIAFGRPYIANPDLVERIQVAAPWNEPDRATFYGGGAKGYTDYPRWGEEVAANFCNIFPKFVSTGSREQRYCQ